MRERIGRYEVTGTLGEGGMGIVYAAHDPHGRQLAFVGEHAAALKAIEWAVDNGFFCAPTIARDPWLDRLRGGPEFGAILRRAEARHRDAVVTFLSAEGDRVLGLGQPA